MESTCTIRSFSVCRRMEVSLEKIPNIDFWQDTVASLLIKDKQVKGVKTAFRELNFRVKRLF